MAEGNVELRPVDIDDTVRLLLKYNEEVQDRSDCQYNPGSMYMVPSVYRDINQRAYTPRVVSIGPFHHQDKHLKGFEVQKATYMNNLLHNVLSPLGSTPEEILKACATKVSDSLDKIKELYIAMPTYSDSKLVRMMVTDACFILAFIYNLFDDDCSLKQNVLLYSHIFLDMVLIENQIPFFVLQDIFECTLLKRDPRVSLNQLIFVILDVCNIFDESLKINSSSISSTYDHDHDHILGFLHKSYHNPDRYTPIQLVKPHSVVELDRSGVRFRPFSAVRDVEWSMAMDVKLSRFLCFPLYTKATLKMPVLRLYDITESVIRNLIIYEHSSEVQACVTSYMCAMDFLIDTPQDVAKLVSSQVLVNYLGSDEEAANIINRICKDVPIKDFYYLRELKQLDDYYNAYWPNLIADVRRRYFSNPWSIIALLVGFVLFILTAVQTFYSVKDSKAG